MKKDSLNGRGPIVALGLFFVSSLFLSAATMQLVKNGDFSSNFTFWTTPVAQLLPANRHRLCRLWNFHLAGQQQRR